jgi:hypothetical protein
MLKVSSSIGEGTLAFVKTVRLLGLGYSFEGLAIRQPWCKVPGLGNPDMASCLTC